MATSLASIFYTTATFPHQVRLLRTEDQRIKTLSVATGVLLLWRTLIVGSRIIVFVLFALLFRYWLLVVVGFHYALMFGLVFYQMRLCEEYLITKIVYNVVTPFVYVFDFCVNWLAGPTRYWYVMCYAPMYCENLAMSALMLWRVATTPAGGAWYVVPGCVSVVVTFPLGVIVQLAYYLYLHPKFVAANLHWSWFRREVGEQNQQKNKLYQSAPVPQDDLDSGPPLIFYHHV